MRNTKNATYNGETTYCPVNAYGDCPYCDQCNKCHIENPIEDCDDFSAFFESWDEWLSYDDIPDDVDETGFDPYMGCYSDDC